jgi:hypothetical protein
MSKVVTISDLKLKESKDKSKQLRVTACNFLESNNLKLNNAVVEEIKPELKEIGTSALLHQIEDAPADLGKALAIEAVLQLQCSQILNRDLTLELESVISDCDDLKHKNDVFNSTLKEYTDSDYVDNLNSKCLQELNLKRQSQHKISNVDLQLRSLRNAILRRRQV